jgi:hypothetical protein
MASKFKGPSPGLGGPGSCSPCRCAGTP